MCFPSKQPSVSKSPSISFSQLPASAGVKKSTGFGDAIESAQPLNPMETLGGGAAAQAHKKMVGKN